MVEYVDLTKTARIKIDADPIPLDPRRDECITGCYTPTNYWGRIADGPEPKFEFPGRLDMAHNRLYDPSAWDDTRRVRRWAWISHGILIQKFESTYWFCDRGMFDTLHGGEFSLENQRAVIDADHRAYVRYVNGEARIVTLQRKATFKRVGKAPSPEYADLYEVWEDIASIGDVYLDENDDAAHLALDSFPLRKPELAVVTAMIDESLTTRKDASNG